MTLGLAIIFIKIIAFLAVYAEWVVASKPQPVLEEALEPSSLHNYVVVGLTKKSKEVVEPEAC